MYKQIIENDEILKLINPYLKGVNAAIVGGFVRDSILNIKSYDRDIVVENVDVEKLAKKIAHDLDAHFVPLDHENKIYRVVWEDKKNYIDISTPIENCIEKDLYRRDLSINAVAFDLNTNEFIDPINGIQDIKNKTLKGICETNITDDPLRILRVFRFYSRLGFTIDKTLLDQCLKYGKLLKNPAKERINTELIKLFEGKFATLALKEMDKIGILEGIFPIISEVKKVPSNTHHHLCLFEHSIETVEQIQTSYENANNEIKKHLDSTVMGNCSRLAFLKLAGFCHDFGKPSTWTIEEETGKHRFIKHDDVGSKLVAPILKELKFSKKQIGYVQKLVKYHIYPSTVVCFSEENEKAQMKFFRKMEDDTIDAIILARADRLSALGEDITAEMVNKNLNGLDKLLNKYIYIRENIKPIEKLLDGNEIMEILNIKQSKKLGLIIKQLHEAQLNSEITTKSEAINFVKNLSLSNES